jgi:cytidylate kinase
MGTVVFKNAQIKIFLSASAEERAKRRYLQLKDTDPSVKIEHLLSDIQARDERDSNRSVAPLIPADDALVIDSTNLSIEEVVDQVFNYMQETFDQA